jgi:hypothetical protein
VGLAGVSPASRDPAGSPQRVRPAADRMPAGPTAKMAVLQNFSLPFVCFVGKLLEAATKQTPRRLHSANLSLYSGGPPNRTVTSLEQFCVPASHTL